MKKETALTTKPESQLPALPQEYVGGGMPQLDAEDQTGQRRWLCLNVKKHPTSGELLRMDYLFDTVAESSVEAVNCVLLGMSYSRRLFYFDGVKNVSLCASRDMNLGCSSSDFTWTPRKHERVSLNKDQKPWSEIMSITEEPFVAGELRNCRTCVMSADALAGASRVRGPCCKEYNFIGSDLETGNFFLFRCRRATASAAQALIEMLSFKVKEPGSFKFQKKMLVPYYFRLELRGEMDVSGNYAKPKFIIRGGAAPHLNSEGKLNWEPAWSPEEMKEWKNLSDQARGVLVKASGDEGEVVGGENGAEEKADLFGSK